MLTVHSEAGLLYSISVGRGAITIMEVGFNPSTLEKGENITVFYEKQWFDATVVNRVQTGSVCSIKSIARPN